VNQGIHWPAPAHGMPRPEPTPVDRGLALVKTACPLPTYGTVWKAS